MKKTMLVNKWRRALAALVVPALVAGSVAVPESNAAEVQTTDTQSYGYDASYIEAVEDLAVNYSEYVDDSVMFELPESISSNEEISVIVTVDTVNLMDAYEGTDKTMSFAEYATSSDDAAEIKKEIASQKAQVTDALDELAVSYSVGEEYSTILSGFEIQIKAKDFETTCQALGDNMNVIVGEVYEPAETELVENEVDVFDTGIFNSVDSGYDGSGMVVAVLDTGIDANHSAFSLDNFTSDELGLSYDDVAALVEDTVASEQLEGLTVDDVYVNDKIPYGFDYADNDPDVYSTHNNHGNHVSGIIAGNDDTIRGVAPNAQIVSMKIFSDVIDTAKTSWILSALEDCVVLGVDVINMSIGTSCGFSRESDEEAVEGIYDRIREAGITMVVAASNSYSSAFGSEANGNLGLTSNPDTATVGSPSTYEGTLSVASISGVETPYMLYDKEIIYFIESTNSTGESNNFFDTLLGEEDSAKLEYVVVPGVGRSADYTGLDVKGKIALVRRGSNTFEEKALIAEEQGAAGIIIYNNVSGDIKMNVGDSEFAVCSISQDDGEMLAKKESGKLTLSREQTSGPFMSDFSSWGPTPALGIKPEITAHGGSILSALTGGGYERLSGTSMACPNLAGVVVLLRQYVVENFPEIADDNVKVNEFINHLLMSTADIAINTNGLPYAVRKQGAGLANLTSAIETKTYLTTYDEEGNVQDKTKLELGDDPEKTGEYEMKFSINNFGDKTVSYELDGYVLTEGVGETKTNAGETTVTEEAYELEGASIKIVSVDGGKLRGNKIKVKGGDTADVTVKVTLTDANKKYLDESFENGMYVEGFITLEAKSGTKIDLNVPYLAFYGDWTVAPLFDLTYYDTHADEMDDGIAIEDKTMADAYATRLIGGVSEDYVSYLGTYYFLQDPQDMVIAANEDYIALSNHEGTVHSLRFAWTGMLRNAAKIEITITDDTTGEVIFEREEKDIRKSYGDGGPSIYPANVKIEFDTMEYNLENNSDYTVKIVGYLDYNEDGGVDTNSKNVYEFPLVADFQAPTVTDVKYYYEYDKTLSKNRLYADVYIYDNHYTMSSQLGYIMNETDSDGNTSPTLKAFESYMTPVYSERNSTTCVKFELTDYIYDIKNNALNSNSFVLTCYDYALNYATYEIGLPDDYSDFYFDGLEEGLTLSENEVYTLSPVVTPSTEWSELLEYASSSPAVVRVVNNKLVAVRKGTAIIKVKDPVNSKNVTFTVTVLGEEDEGYRRYDASVADVFSLDGFYTQKAYYIIDNAEKEIGDTGTQNFFDGDYSLSLYPSESVTLSYSLDAFYPNDTTVEFETSNESIVTIDASGTVTAVAEGFASVTIKVLQDGRSTYYSETVSVEVKDPFVTTGASLTHYYGNGGLVDIPKDLSLTEIGKFSFSNYNYVEKTEEDLALDDSEKTKQWYIGENTITKVVIPEGVTKIDAYAFAQLTALEEVVLPSTLTTIEYGAFKGCTSLQKITFSGENNLKIINKSAFENCDLRETIELPSICVISAYAFAGNKKLEGIVLGESLLSVGQHAFAACKGLTDVTVNASKVKYGAYAFTDCEALTTFYVNSSVLPEGMFYECEALESVTIGPDVNDIGVFAFRDTKVAKFEVSAENKTYKVQTADHILSADGTKLIAVSPLVIGKFTSANITSDQVTEISKGAFSSNQKISEIVLENVTVIGEYGLASNESLEKVTFGVLSTIDEYAFFETSITVMPEFTEKTEIGKYAFSHTKLKTVKIPDKMTIEEGTFSECTELEKVVVGNEVTLGKFAFSMNKDEAFKVKKIMDGTQKMFIYEFSSPIQTITIGDDAVIGENAFANAASVETVKLGKNAEVEKMAFYNMSSLKNIDLSQAKKIGDYAFSGDVYYACMDDAMSVAAVGADGYYRYTYHGPVFTSVDVSMAESIGLNAFSYCRELETVVLSEELKEIPEYAFAGCSSLKKINSQNVETIGKNAFMECGLEKIDLSSAKTVSEYAFTYNEKLASVKLNEKGTDIEEGAFAYCAPLTKVENLSASETIGDYAFAYVGLTEVDLTSAVTIGKNAFMKESLTPFKVTLGDDLEKLGDNPFAMCEIAPFSKTEVEKDNGVETEVVTYNYEISDEVVVIDGSLYCKVPKGMELITFAGTNTEDVVVADDTVRITTMAFAGSDVVRVKMPYTTTAIGHKAFYACNELEMVIFGSYTIPNFEEEFDQVYFDSFQNIPGSGTYGEYEDYDGTQVIIEGTGLIPYYMWNITDGMYSNVFYGANFIDYVGRVENKITMVRPVNGVGYDSYIADQYFDLRIDGPAAPNDTAVDAINAIKAIPERVSYEDKALVEAARAAYDKIATTEQLALVTNYSDLISAEQRIKALDPDAVAEEAADTEDEETAKEETKKDKDGKSGAFFGVLGFAVLVALLVVLWKKNKERLQPVIDKVAESKFGQTVGPVCAKVIAAVKPVAKKVGTVIAVVAVKVAKVVADVAVKVAKALTKAIKTLVVTLKDRTGKKQANETEKEDGEEDETEN